VTFYYVKAEVQHPKHALPNPGRKVEVIGVVMVFISIGANCLGALWVEKFLKGNKCLLHEQKCHLLLGEVMVNVALMLLEPVLLVSHPHRHHHLPLFRSLFVGWDWRVLFCAAVWIPAGWTATMLVKRCSNLQKTVSQGTSGALTYVFSVVPLSSFPRSWVNLVAFFGPPLTPEPFSWPAVLLAITVMLAALTFGTEEAQDASEKSVTMKPVVVPLPRACTSLSDLGSAYKALRPMSKMDSNESFGKISAGSQSGLSGKMTTTETRLSDQKEKSLMPDQPERVESSTSIGRTSQSSFSPSNSPSKKA